MTKDQIEQLKQRIRTRTQRINDQVINLKESGCQLSKLMKKVDEEKHPELMKVLNEILAQIEIMTEME